VCGKGKKKKVFQSLSSFVDPSFFFFLSNYESDFSSKLDTTTPVLPTFFF